MRERPIIMGTESVRAILAGRKTQTRRVCKTQPNENWNVLECGGGNITYMRPPYSIGDRLWVKEKYGYDNEGELMFPSDLEDDSVQEWDKIKLWKNPMFMPRNFSRLTLEVVGIWVEHLQDINVACLEKEGVKTFDESMKFMRKNFQLVWNKLNAKRGFSWESNPLVWVIEFRKL